MGKRQYPHLTRILDEPTRESLRLLWDRVYGHADTLAAADATITNQAALIASLQTRLATTDQNAAQALLLVGKTVEAVANLPTPPPPAPVDTFTYADHLPDVQALYVASPPALTVEGAFKFAQTLAWMFNAEMNDGVLFPMGLLIKTSGENVYTCGGVDYSASRICYPNGKIFKVLGDVPTGNTPEWLDDGYVDLSRYHVATDPSAAC